MGTLATVLVCALVLALVAPANAEPPVGVLDLRTDFDARIDGADPSDGAGQGVAAAGDVNGDGRQDLLVRTFGESPFVYGHVFVVFGRQQWSDLDLALFGPTDGLRIDGAIGPCGASFGTAGCSSRSVAGAGDVNGDGLDDVIVGSPAGTDPSPDPPGSAYVVFGRASGGTVDVAALGPAGFRIRGVGSQNETGRSVSGAGDVNGDGLDDVVLAVPGRREAYVVFGRTSTTTVELASLGTAGFRMNAGDGFFTDRTGGVAGLGDTNGDGLSDVIVGVPRAGANENGRAYVVFGKVGSGAVDLQAPGSGGYLIEDTSNDISAALGQSVSEAGDVDGDGNADMIVGAQGADKNVGGSGSAYVVFGKQTTEAVDLRSFVNGFRIDGKGVLHGAGASVAGGADANGDGRPDIVVGEPFGDFEGRFRSGSAYIVFGKPSSGSVRLGGLNAGQVEIGGAQESDGAGTSVATADFDGDGRADVLAGAPGVDQVRIDAGAAYLVFTRLLPRTLTLSPAQQTNAVGDEHCVTAHVEDAGATPAAGFAVRFDVVGVNSVSATGETGANGDAVLCYTGRLDPGTDEITAYADGNANGVRDLGEPGALAGKAWIVPSGERDCVVSFNGHITTEAPSKATFTGRAELSVTGTVGRLSYLDRGPPRLRLRSRDVAALVCAEDGRSATLFGEAKLNGGQTAYRIDLEAGRGSREGRYRIQLGTGYDSGKHPLEGGSIRIHLH